jgi:CHAT domain-containing protein
VGGVRYDRKPDPVSPPPADAPPARPAVSGQKSETWPELPGTAREVARVAALAKRLSRPPRVVERQGTAAGTGRLLADLPGARWAHLATHGYFAAPRSEVRKYLYREADFGRGRRGERRGAGARNPLTQSGLVLAGANLPRSETGDGGILTAEVIAGLPLDGLELAVLSACETGLGEAAAGEGVFGLQRAFHLAGARNVVAGLWRVGDEPTAALMALFYHYLWEKKRPPLEALRQAQLALYRHPQDVPALARVRAPNFAKTVKRVTTAAKGPRPAGKTAPVKQWAAFVLSGAGRGD